MFHGKYKNSENYQGFFFFFKNSFFSSVWMYVCVCVCVWRTSFENRHTADELDFEGYKNRRDERGGEKGSS